MDAHNGTHELDWTAFCYAAGEMTPGEAAAFEDRLATHQTAREALARAVELTQAVASAESLEATVVIRSRPAAWSRRLTWMAIGAAASLLIAVLWNGSGIGPRWQAWLGSKAGGSLTDTRELAAAWSQTRQELAGSESGLWYPAHLDATDEPADETHFDDVLPATPSWMTAAMESLPVQPADGDTTPFDGDRTEN